MQASARNRDAFAGSTGEDQPEQQTVWRKADPGTKGGVAAPTDGPALAAFEVVHHGLRHDLSPGSECVNRRVGFEYEN